MFVSLFVHLAVGMLSFFSTKLCPIFTGFDAVKFYVDYVKAMREQPLDLPAMEAVVICALLYFTLSAVIGFLPGLLLGREIRRQVRPWTLFFVKHRWMLDMIQTDRDAPVYARVILKDRGFSTSATTSYPIVVEGILRDSYFGSDGKLLYLVFWRFEESKPHPARVRALDGLFGPPSRTRSTATHLLVVEGSEVALARYSRGALPLDELDSLPLGEPKAP